MSQERRLRAMIVEDEWVARSFLTELLQGTDLAEVVVAVASAEEADDFLTTTGRTFAIDAVFVDIHLAGSADSGLSLVKAWRGRADAPRFVMATAMREHAIEAFDLGVADYVLKPFTAERVRACVERLQAQRRQVVAPTPQRIVARKKRSLVFLELDDIWAFESADRLTVVHTPHGVFDVDLSLASIEASFSARFTRVHRNWLVNEAHIRELDRDGGESTLFVGAAYDDASPGVRVPVSRDRAPTLREQLLATSPGVRKR